MATHTAQSILLQICNVDLVCSDNGIASYLVSTNHIAKWGQARFTDPHISQEPGISVSPYLNPLSKQGLSGVLNPHSCQYVGLSRHGEDQDLFPVLSEGKYVMSDDISILPSERTITEIFNKTSNMFLSETSNRHVLNWPVDGKSDISAKIYSYQSGISKTYREYSYVSDLTVYPNHTSNAFHLGNQVDWGMVDTCDYEFMLDRQLASSTELLFNTPPTIWFGPVDTANTSTFVDILETCQPLAATHRYKLPYYPVTDVTIYGRIGNNISEWTATDSISGDGLLYKLYPHAGEILVNHTASESPTTFLAMFNAVPEIQYQFALSSPGLYMGNEVSARRIPAKNAGNSLLIIEDESSKQEAYLEFIQTPDNMYYNDPASYISVVVKDWSNNSAISGAPIELHLINRVGKLFGSIDYTATSYSDENGTAVFAYRPPSYSEVEKTNFEVIPPHTNILHTVDSLPHGFKNQPSEIYTYLIYKDDPLVGRIDDPNNPADTVIYDPVMINGRRQILYSWNTQAWHPIDNTQGAFAPTRPAYINNTSIGYAAALPEANRSDNNIPIAGYSIIGPREAKFAARLIDPSIAPRVSGTAEKTINITLSAYAKGDYTVTSQKYPIGWKLPSTNIKAGSILGGALYITVNPIAGEYTDIFETTDMSPSGNMLGLSITVTV